MNSSNGSNVDKKAIDERWKANEERWKTAGYENWLIWTTYSEKQDVERKIEKANKNSLTNSNNQAPNNTNIWNVDKGEMELSSDWPTDDFSDLGDPRWRTMMELDEDEVVSCTDKYSKDSKGRGGKPLPRKKKKKKRKPKNKH